MYINGDVYIYIYVSRYIWEYLLSMGKIMEAII